MVLGGMGIMVFGLLLVGWGFLDKSRMTKRVGEAPTAMGSLGKGKVAVTGLVRALAGLKSPASDRPCTYYEVVHEQGQYDTRTRHTSWHNVALNAMGIFVIDDGTGMAVVWPHGAEMDFTRPWSYESGFKETPGMEETAMKSRKRDRFISEGDYVYVRGTRHTLDELLIRVKDPRSPGIPQEALEALTKDENLKKLPCFLSDGNYFAIADQVYSARLERLGSTTGVLLMVGGLMFLMGAFVAVSALLGFA